MKKVDKLSLWLKDAVGNSGAKPQGVSNKKQNNRPSKNGPQKGQGQKPQKNFGGKKSFDGKKNFARKKVVGKKPQGVQTHKGVTRIIPIGGLEEVGKNSMVFEHERDILVVDMGFEFPEDELFGVDYVIPDISYLVKRKNRIKGIVITHGHLDHIGALPYVLAELGYPTVYASKLTAGLIKQHLAKNKGLKGVNIKVIDVARTYNFGAFKVDFFRVNHSIPDALGLCIQSPEGRIVHTGDFKFDFTPADGVEADIGKMTEIGKRGVDLMFSDSTNATKPGHTMSEQVVAEALEKSIKDADGRIIIACFASLIGRMQQMLDFARRHDRKVFFSGRSIENNSVIAKELGFLKWQDGDVKSIKQAKDFPDRKTLVLTTGSQGEPMAALSRMAAGAHAQIKIKPGDTVVVSASPIIGNEKSVAFLVDGLSRLGAKVVHNGIMDVHTTGHGQQEDLKMMMSLIKPTVLAPVHGNYFMRKAHADLAPLVGVKETHLLDNGGVLELRKGKVFAKNEDVGVNHVVIDGHGKGDLSSHVLKEREAMAQNGVVNILLKMRKGKLVGSPMVSTHGFVYQKEMVKAVKDVEARAKSAVYKMQKKNPRASAQDYENFVRSEVSGFVLKTLNRRPLIAPVVLHV
jgi:ribonuclease J